MSDDLIKFMEQKLGGKEAVYKEYVKERLTATISGGATFGELVDTAKKEGWLETLNSVKLSTLFGTASGPAVKTGTGKRMTRVEKEELIEKILSFLGKKPWSSKGEMMTGIRPNGTKVGPQLAALKIKSVGARATMKYALKGEKTKG